MTTGENSGTWGNVTNVNLGTAIEEAIVGSADVTFSSADVTLTLTDSNATQTARNLRLNLTGTISAAQNLVVPAIEKVYIVNNGLTYDVTVKNSTGTGIVVPAGKTMWVYNNGTNVVDAVTYLTSLTLGTALPVASGGTGTNSTTYCNLQTNVTGTLPNANTTASSSNGSSTIVARDASGNFTGANVTATNFIGTLNGSGANVSSLNASSVSSGTLAVSYGGTGITSAGTSGNVLTSNGSAWVSQAITSVNTSSIAKAWVHFNGSGSIYSSYNISSVSQVATGRYTINFSSSFANTNYAWAGSASGSSGNVYTQVAGWSPDDNNYSTGSITIATEGVNNVLYNGSHTTAVFFAV